MGPSDETITGLLHAWGQGDRAAYEELVRLVYGELRRLAQRHLRRERTGHTLQPTALVHEAFLRLQGQTAVRWQNRSQFFAVAAQAMRRILVDHARTRGRLKRGGDVVRVSLDDDGKVPGAAGGEAATTPRGVDLLDLDRALNELADLDPELARVIELRYLGGLTIEETAAAMDTSPATVKRAWVTARAWLLRRLEGVP